MVKIKKILMISIATIVASIVLITNISNAQSFDDWIIPKSDNSNLGQIVLDVWEWWKVWDNYKDKSQDGSLSLWDQLASGIMTWDTILYYIVELIKWIWWIALLAWALWIIYYGYVKATEHLKSSGGGKLWMVVVGILVISFAYVIVKWVWVSFIS